MHIEFDNLYGVNLLDFALPDCDNQCLNFNAKMNKYKSCMIDTVGVFPSLFTVRAEIETVRRDNC